MILLQVSYLWFCCNCCIVVFTNLQIFTHTHIYILSKEYSGSTDCSIWLPSLRFIIFDSSTTSSVWFFSSKSSPTAHFSPFEVWHTSSRFQFQFFFQYADLHPQNRWCWRWGRCWCSSCREIESLRCIGAEVPRAIELLHSNLAHVRIHRPSNLELQDPQGLLFASVRASKCPAQGFRETASRRLWS